MFPYKWKTNKQTNKPSNNQQIVSKPASQLATDISKEEDSEIPSLNGGIIGIQNWYGNGVILLLLRNHELNLTHPAQHLTSFQ